MTTYPDIELYIDGRWKRADGHPIINPADESVIGTVPHAAMADLDDALAAAERGYRVWKNTAPARRAQIILKAASLIRERVDQMAVAMTLEQSGAAGNITGLRHHRVGCGRGLADLRTRHPQ